MLTHISIQNFTLVQHLDLDIQPGMTVISGETGAGKSILLSALGQTLGDRAEADRVRTGASRADICASFDISRIPRAQDWLSAQDLHQPEAPHECLLRRLINNEGKSKSYINGQPVTLLQLRTLGEMLIDIHSQHEHQSLLIKDNHRQLLDEFGGHCDLAQQVRSAYREWQSGLEKYTNLRDNATQVSARLQLLRYQLNEFEQLNLQLDELGQLETEQRSLANAGEILQSSHDLLALCNHDEQGLNSGLHRGLHILRNMPEKSEALLSAESLLLGAQIQVDEARREIERHIGTFNLDPERLELVEDRLSSIYDLARKHRIRPEAIPELSSSLSLELAQLDGGSHSPEQLAEQVKVAENNYLQRAGQLSNKRLKTASHLAEQVNAQLKALAMENAQFRVNLNSLLDKPSANGLEDVEFLISTNPGQTPKALAKVASGGELSRISLAIQVVAAQTSATSTLVFDEVDVGIGGATADIVGRLLRQLGERGQVICVTHLAQVASKGHQHLRVSKMASSTQAETTLNLLAGEDKVQEIARMLAGATVTEQSIAHAREMLQL